MKSFSNLFKGFGKTKSRIIKTLSPRVTSANKKRKVYTGKFVNFSRRKPLTSFGVILVILLALIIVSNVLTSPKPKAEETTLPTKNVEVYTIGESPKITVQAVVEKSGVVKVVALGGGVVQKINVEPGQEVSRGTNLVSMSTNYQGGNVFSAQRQLAQVQYKSVLDTYNTQKDLINKQKELANKSDENADELRRISNDSLSSTRSLISLNNEMLSAAEAAQAQAEANNDPQAVAQAKSLRAQLMSANLQLETGLRNSEFSGSDTNPQAELSDISKDIAIKQLDLQQKALDLNKEVSRISVVIAQINEALMYPSAPFSGKVERIYVKEGQVVSPGTPLVQISGNSQSLIAVALLSREMSQGISKAVPSTLRFGKEEFSAVPFYVSTEATDGNLYSAQFSIPEEFSSEVADKGYITIEMPIDFPNTGSTVPFIPIDAVFQTQDQAFVFTAVKGKAKSTKVILGEVVGRYVEIKNGLGAEDRVILNRNVINGDPVKISN